MRQNLELFESPSSRNLHQFVAVMRLLQHSGCANMYGVTWLFAREPLRSYLS